MDRRPGVVVYGEHDRVEEVGRPKLGFAVAAHQRLALAVALDLVVGVAVISGDEQTSGRGRDGVGKSADGEVDALDRNASCGEVGGVADHVATGEVHPDEAELAGAHRLDGGVGISADFIQGRSSKGTKVRGSRRRFPTAGRTCWTGCRSRSR